MASYKIKELETLTGIKAHTLRIWEKRYGILQPNRTDTKIRTYSDDDVSRILNVSILNNHGWKISKIARMDEESLRKEVLAVSKNQSEDSVVVSLLIQSLIYMDEPLFNRVIDRASKKESFRMVYKNYLIPFLERIGVMWLVNSINPAQEHFISSLIRQKLVVAIDRLPVPEKTEVDYILFCREEEWHEIGLLYYYFCLKEKGQNVVYLGQNVPYDSILECVQLLNPTKGLVSSFIASISPENLKEYLSSFYHKTKMPLFVGGNQVETLLDETVPYVYTVNKIIQ